MMEQRSAGLNSQLEQADKLFREGKIAQAIEIYQVIIQSDDPQRDHPISGLGSIRHQRGYYQTRVSDWYFSIGKEVKRSVYDALSLCYSIHQDYEECRKYYESMHQSYPSNHSLRFGLANTYNNQGNIQRAMSEYEIIAKFSEVNRDQCLRQLALIHIAAGRKNECRDCIKRIKKENKDVVVWSVEVLTREDGGSKIEALQQLLRENPSYLKLYIYIARQYELESNAEKAIETYRQCITVSKNINIFYEAPYIYLIQYLKDSEQSLKYAKQLLQQIPNSWLPFFLLAELYLKFNDLSQSQKYHNLCKSYLDSANPIYLSKANSSFISQVISQNLSRINRLKIYRVVEGDINTVINLSEQLYSSLEEDVNVNLTKLRLENKGLFDFIKLMQEEQPDQSIVQEIYKLYQEKQINLQLVHIFCCEYILKSLADPQASLQNICNKLSNILNQQITSITVQNFELINLVEQQQQKLQYKIKCKKKTIDVFDTKQISTYFSKYHHLYTVIKKINNNKVKSIQKYVTELMNLIKSKQQLQVVDDRIIFKIEPKNEYICINQIIQQLLPQVHDQQSIFMKQLERSFATTFKKELPEFVELMMKKWQILITHILKKRREKSQEIHCNITDWITVQFVFSTQVKAIQCLKFLQVWCNDKHYYIIRVQGHLDSEEQLRVKIVINDICCTIKLQINNQIKRKRFKEIIRLVVNSNKNPIFNTFLNVNKKHEQSLLQYLEDACENLEPSQQNIEKLGCVQSLLSKIECIDNWQSLSKFQKLKLSQSMIGTSMNRKRTNKRMLTQFSQNGFDGQRLRTEQSVQTQMLSLHLPKTSGKERLRKFSQNNLNTSFCFSEEGEKEHYVAPNKQNNKRSLIFLDPNNSKRNDENQRQNNTLNISLLDNERLFTDEVEDRDDQYSKEEDDAFQFREQLERKYSEQQLQMSRFCKQNQTLHQKIRSLQNENHQIKKGMGQLQLLNDSLNLKVGELSASLMKQNKQVQRIGEVGKKDTEISCLRKAIQLPNNLERSPKQRIRHSKEQQQEQRRQEYIQNGQENTQIEIFSLKSRIQQLVQKNQKLNNQNTMLQDNNSIIIRQRQMEKQQLQRKQQRQLIQRNKQILQKNKVILDFDKQKYFFQQKGRENQNLKNQSIQMERKMQQYVQIISKLTEQIKLNNVNLIQNFCRFQELECQLKKEMQIVSTQNRLIKQRIIQITYQKEKQQKQSKQLFKNNLSLEKMRIQSQSTVQIETIRKENNQLKVTLANIALQKQRFAEQSTENRQRVAFLNRQLNQKIDQITILKEKMQKIIQKNREGKKLEKIKIESQLKEQIETIKTQNNQLKDILTSITLQKQRISLQLIEKINKNNSEKATNTALQDTRYQNQKSSFLFDLSNQNLESEQLKQKLAKSTKVVEQLQRQLKQTLLQKDNQLADMKVRYQSLYNENNLKSSSRKQIQQLPIQTYSPLKSSYLQQLSFSKKKTEYIIILFTILLFEAITLSVTMNLMK